MNWKEICKGCGRCCGPVPFEDDFLRRFKRRLQKKGKRTQLYGKVIIVTDDGMCPFLTDEKLCAVYEYRPLVCKLCGTVPEMPCERLGQDPKARDEMFERSPLFT